MTTPTTPTVPPQVQMLDLVTSIWLQKAIFVAAKLGIADQLADGPKSSDELARATEMHATSLYRVLRFLSSRGIFTEGQDRRFGLTPLAETLRSEGPGSLRAFAIMVGSPFHTEWWKDPLISVRTGRSTIEETTGKNGFEWMQQNPEARAIFDAAMTSYSKGVHSAVVAAYPFAGVKTLCDVGGGEGALLAGILKEHPQMRGIVFDQPHLAASAKALLQREGVAARASFESGSFFERVPQGADAYILSHIIHDWDDERSVAILKRCRQAMAKGGKILLVEIVLPQGNAPSFGKGLDLEMLIATAGGKERTAKEFAELYRAAGLQLADITPTQSHISVIEGVPG